MSARVDLSPYAEGIRTASLYRRTGRIEKVVGTVLESRGPDVAIGNLCEIRLGRDRAPILAEVVGFNHERVQLMPLGPVAGMVRGAEVVALRVPFTVPVGDRLLGRVIDARGNVLSGDPLAGRVRRRHVTNAPPPALSREPIREPVSTGVRAIDGLLLLGRGQRVGIFAGSGVGKSTLLGMIARQTSADVTVVAMVGERGREVREFIETDLGPDGLARSVVVVSTSDEPAVMRIKAGLTAMTIAEAFRARGKHVMFLMDSVTRTAMALREIGLATGEPPTSRGYTPSVFAFLPGFFERAGSAERGSITGFFTVLVEGDDVNDPIADAVRSILDGHIVLSRARAAQAHYPPIEPLDSVSRLMSAVGTPEHVAAADRVRSLLATYRHYEDLVAVGAYRRGQNAELDRALHFLPRIDAFLKQGATEASALGVTRDALVTLAADIDAHDGRRGDASA